MVAAKRRVVAGIVGGLMGLVVALPAFAHGPALGVCIPQGFIHTPFGLIQIPDHDMEIAVGGQFDHCSH